MATPSLFPLFMKAQSGDARPSGVVGGFIEGEVEPSLAATVSGGDIAASVANGGIEGIVAPNFTAEIGPGIQAEITVIKIEGEI